MCSSDLTDLSVGNHLLKVVATNATGEIATDEISIKVIDKNSVENIPTWKADVTYATAGTQVLHNNNVWSNKWWTQGDEPGKADVWELLRDGGDNNGGDNNGGDNNGGDNNGGDNNGGDNNGGDNNGEIAQYDPSKSYPTPGTIVIYNGKKYKSKWWVNIGDIPGTVNGPWELILENGEGTTPDKAEAYDINIPYPNPNTYVIYNGKTYKNKWYVSPGDYPEKDQWGPWELVK